MGASGVEWRCGVSVACCVADEWMALLEQVVCHMNTHVAETDEPDTLSSCDHQPEDSTAMAMVSRARVSQLEGIGAVWVLIATDCHGDVGRRSGCV